MVNELKNSSSTFLLAGSRTLDDIPLYVMSMKFKFYVNTKKFSQGSLRCIYLPRSNMNNPSVTRSICHSEAKTITRELKLSHWIRSFFSFYILGLKEKGKIYQISLVGIIHAIHLWMNQYEIKKCYHEMTDGQNVQLIEVITCEISL